MLWQVGCSFKEHEINFPDMRQFGKSHIRQLRWELGISELHSYPSTQEKCTSLISPLRIPLLMATKDLKTSHVTEQKLSKHFSSLQRFEKSGEMKREGWCTEMAYEDFHGNALGCVEEILISLQLQPTSSAHTTVTDSPGRVGDNP